MSDRDKIIEIIRKEEKFYLISHMLPDGDSIGSLLGMGMALTLAGKKIKMYTPGQMPRKYAFLKGADLVQGDQFGEDADTTVIVLDSSDPERLGELRDAVLKSSKIINIDHHVTNQHFGNYNYVEPKASATGEMVYEILKEAGLEINRDIAESLYVAISTDTGSFKYDNTTPRTHLVIAELLKYGLSPALLSQRVFDERPLSFYILLREALSGLEMYADRRIAVMTLSRDIRQRSAATSDDLEGIVNYSRNIEGIELGILFYVDTTEEVKVGFRSKQLDVSELAGRFNGGGHARAAGCRIKGGFEMVKQNVIAEAEKMLQLYPV